MDEEIKETLKKQLELLSERSWNKEADNSEIVELSKAMAEIAEIFTH